MMGPPPIMIDTHHALPCAQVGHMLNLPFFPRKMESCQNEKKKHLLEGYVCGVDYLSSKTIGYIQAEELMNMRIAVVDRLTL